MVNLCVIHARPTVVCFLRYQAKTAFSSAPFGIPGKAPSSNPRRFKPACSRRSAWKAVAPLLDPGQWADVLHVYQPGSWGPEESDALLQRDGAVWFSAQ